MIFGLFVCFIISGILTPFSYNHLNVKLLLELLFLSLVFLGLRKIKKQLLGYLIIAAIYILYSYILAYTHKITDFIMIYKTFLYLIMLSLVLGRRVFDYSFIKYLFYILIGSLLFKYVYSLLFQITHRPGLLTENNFELVLLLLLFLAKRSFENRVVYLDYILLFLILVLSGSRSAILCMIPLLWFERFGENLIYKSIKYIGFLFAFILALLVIYFRMEGMSIEDVDRVKFLSVFLQEIEGWSFWNYLFGNPPITALSNANCSFLNYYEKLFSDINTNLCYSVVLHSHILRSILDHGILGLLFIYLYLFRILQLSMLDKKIIYPTLLILLINSLSVSSFNSVFAIFGLLILINLKKENITANE